jgi:CHC2 zinc finger
MTVLSSCTDIKALIEYHATIQTVGRPVRVHGVLEYHSNCPWCGGTDRFITRPEEGTYSCAIRASGCGRFGDMISFLREYCTLSFREACEEIGIDPRDLVDYTPTTPPSAQVSGPPSRVWQERGERMVAKAQVVLRSWEGRAGLSEGTRTLRWNHLGQAAWLRSPGP